jgi:hypothetical protein
VLEEAAAAMTDERSTRLGTILLFVNLLLILFGLFAFAWKPASRTVHTAAPSIHAYRAPGQPGRLPSC